MSQKLTPISLWALIIGCLIIFFSLVNYPKVNGYGSFYIFLIGLTSGLGFVITGLFFRTWKRKHPGEVDTFFAYLGLGLTVLAYLIFTLSIRFG